MWVRLRSKYGDLFNDCLMISYGFMVMFTMYCGYLMGWYVVSLYGLMMLNGSICMKFMEAYSEYNGYIIYIYREREIDSNKMDNIYMNI